MSHSKPREFWIKQYNYEDAISEKPKEDWTHVIEYSAVQRLEQRIDTLKLMLQRLGNAVTMGDRDYIISAYIEAREALQADSLAEQEGKV